MYKRQINNRTALQILVLVVSHDGIAQLVFEDRELDLTKEAMSWMKGYQEHLKGTGRKYLHAVNMQTRYITLQI